MFGAFWSPFDDGSLGYSVWVWVLVFWFWFCFCFLFWPRAFPFEKPKKGTKPSAECHSYRRMATWQARAGPCLNLHMEFMLLMALATPAKVNCMLMKADFLLLASIPLPAPASILASRLFSCRHAFLKSEKFKDCCRRRA